MNRIKTHDRPPPGQGLLPVTPAEGQLASLVGALWEAGDGLRRPREECPSRQQLPSRNAVIDIVEALRSVLFPGYFGPSDLTPENAAFHMGSTLDRVGRDLREQIRRGFCFACRERLKECEARTEAAAERFFCRLPAVRLLLATDVQAAYE